MKKEGLEQTSRETKSPTREQIAEFKQACREVKHPGSATQWAKFAEAAMTIHQEGWTNAKIGKVVKKFVRRDALSLPPEEHIKS